MLYCLGAMEVESDHDVDPVSVIGVGWESIADKEDFRPETVELLPSSTETCFAFVLVGVRDLALRLGDSTSLSLSLSLRPLLLVFHGLLRLDSGLLRLSDFDFLSLASLSSVNLLLISSATCCRSFRFSSTTFV